MPTTLEMPTVAPRTVHQPAKTVLSGKERLILELERIQYEKMMGHVPKVDYDQNHFYGRRNEHVLCCIAGLALCMEIGILGIEDRIRLDREYRCHPDAIKAANRLLGIDNGPHADWPDIFKSCSTWPYSLTNHYLSRSKTEAGIMALNRIDKQGRFIGDEPTFRETLLKQGKSELDIVNIISEGHYVIGVTVPNFIMPDFHISTV